MNHPSEDRPTSNGSHPLLGGAIALYFVIALEVLIMISPFAAFFYAAFAFALRAYTVGRLPLWSDGRVTVLPILTADNIMLKHRMSDVLLLPEVRSRLEWGSGAILGYLVPQNYIMQGMIADTDPSWRLYEHHQTLAMITDWILHPFRQLQGGHSMMHAPSGGKGTAAPSSGMVRRLIFLRVEAKEPGSARSKLFSINATRTPEFFVDVDMHALALLEVKDLGSGTGWGLVPTPMF